MPKYNGYSYRKAFVTIHDDKAFPCILFENDRWNGWAVPYFATETAKEVAEAITSNNAELDEYRCVVTWDAATKSFELDENSTAPEEEREDYRSKVSVDFTIDGIDYYGIGGYSWTWSEVDPRDFCRECRMIHAETSTRRHLCADCRRRSRMAARSRA